MASAIDRIAALFEQAGVAYAVIGAHAVNAWIEPRLTADIDVTALLDREILSQGGVRVATPEDLIVLKRIANRAKDQIDVLGLVALPSLDWAYVERRAAEWEVVPLQKRARGR